MMLGRGYGYGNMMGGFGWFGWLFMLLFAALVVAGIVVAVLWAIRSSSGGETHGTPVHGRQPGHDEAVAIAKRRLANGEITREQYEEIIRTLGT